MIALARDDLFVIQLALDMLVTDTARKQKAALKRRDDAKLKRLAELGDAACEAKRKVVLMKGGAA